MMEKSLQGVYGVGVREKNGLYVFLDLLCPAGNALARSKELSELLSGGIKAYFVPIAIINGSIPYGETFLATENLDLDPKVLNVRKLMYSWLGKEEERLSVPIPSDPRDWFGPSIVLENTYRLRSLFQGSGAVASPTILYRKDGKLKVIQGVPSAREYGEIRKDLKPKGLAQAEDH
jgi:hypothetical protein